MSARRAAAAAGVLALAALAALAAGALAPAPAGAQGERASALADAVDRELARFEGDRDFQGSVLVARGDTVLVERTVSFVTDPARAASLRCGVGLLARTFTAAAIQRLEMHGKLRLEDSLGRFVPGLGRLGAVRLDDLLRHRSGVPDFTDDPAWPRLRLAPTTPAALAKRLAAQPLDFAPGSRGAASQSDYALLARVVEVAGGRPYADCLRAELLEPLALHDTGTLQGSQRAGALLPGWDPGPLPGGAQPPVQFDWSWLVGNGDIASTPRDLLRWTRAVLHDGFIDRSVRTHPYGWGLRVVPPLRTIEQGGRVGAGYAAKIVYVLNDDVTVIVLADLQTDAVARLADALVQDAEGTPVRMAAARTTVQLTPEQLAGLAGRYGPGPQFALTVRTDAAGAWLAGPDGDFLPLDAEDPNSFRFRVADEDISFERDSTGRATVLHWSGFGSAPRLP